MADLKSTRVVIVEDHLMFRAVLRKICEKELGWNVVAEAGNADGAIKQIQRTGPDIVILDLRLDDSDGISVAKAVAETDPRVRFVAVSSYCDEHTVYRVESQNLHGFVDKKINTPEMLTKALARVAVGGRYFSDSFNAAKQARANNPRSFDKTLSERECEILALIGHSLSDDEIATKLALAPQTVTTHRKHIMTRLGIHSAPKLIAYAIHIGISRP